VFPAERATDIDRQTDRDRQADRQADRQTDRQTDRLGYAGFTALLITKHISGPDMVFAV